MNPYLRYLREYFLVNVVNEKNTEGYYWECSNDSTITVYDIPEEIKRDTGLVDQYGEPIYIIEKKYRMGYL